MCFLIIQGRYLKHRHFRFIHDTHKQKGRGLICSGWRIRNNFGEEGTCGLGLERKNGGRRAFKAEEVLWAIMRGAGNEVQRVENSPYDCPGCLGCGVCKKV